VWVRGVREVSTWKRTSTYRPRVAPSKPANKNISLFELNHRWSRSNNNSHVLIVLWNKRCKGNWKSISAKKTLIGLTFRSRRPSLWGSAIMCELICFNRWNNGCNCCVCCHFSYNHFAIQTNLKIKVKAKTYHWTSIYNNPLEK